uniref:Lipocalin n=1 Tax=Rhipicephalus zambeziensis TaxID=60191 RepID=A0A224YNA8_9ACAR
MWEKHFFVVALFAVIVTTVYSRCTPGCSLNNLDIQNFFNTTEPIWVFNSTAIEKQGCKVDVRSYIEGKNIHFKRLYIQHRQTIRQELTGVIHKHEFDRIYINEHGRHCQQEKLMYLSHDLKCAVVMVTIVNSNVTPYFELRVRNSSVATQLDYECHQTFSSHRSGYSVYAADCQRILEPGCRQSPCRYR